MKSLAKFAALLLISTISFACAYKGVIKKDFHQTIFNYQERFKNRFVRYK